MLIDMLLHNFLIFQSFFQNILHSSYTAYGTSAIFTTTSIAFKYALAPVFNYTILLVVPTPSRRYGFWAQCPPTCLSLLWCINFSPSAILHCLFSLFVPPVQSLYVPRVDFVIFGSRPLAYFGLLLRKLDSGNAAHSWTSPQNFD
jgi:hypothetical protein